MITSPNLPSQRLYRVQEILMRVPGTDYPCPYRDIYVSEIWVLFKTLTPLKNRAYSEICYSFINSIVMFSGFTNTKISNNHKLPSHNNLFYFRGEGDLPHSFLFCSRLEETPIPIPFRKWGDIQVWLIKTTCFTFIVTTN